MQKKHLLAFSFLCFLLVLPYTAGAASVVTHGSASPGSTSTIFGMPIIQTFSGLDVSSAYILYDETGGNATTSFSSDTAGKALVTVVPTAYGQNVYVLRLAGGVQALTFSVDNMDIMPYLIVLITVVIIFSVIGMFTGKGGKGGIF